MLKFFWLCCLWFAMVQCAKKKVEISAVDLSYPTAMNLNEVKFLNAEIGFAMGGDRFKKPLLLKTMDGGQHWASLSIPQGSEEKEIFGFDINAQGEILTVGYGGTIFHSKDSGNSWVYSQHPSWEELHDVCFRESDTSVIVGGRGFNMGWISKYLRQTQKAEPIDDQRNFELRDIDAPTNDVLYVSGYGAVLKSVNGGEHWDFTAAENDYFTAMAWRNSNEGVVVGYGGSICTTHDGGASWKTVRNGNKWLQTKIHWKGIAENGSGIYVAVGEKGKVFRSLDDGASWKEVTPFTDKDLHAVNFIDAQHIIIVGEKGCIFKLLVE